MPPEVVVCGRCQSAVFTLRYDIAEYILQCEKGHVIKRFYSIQQEVGE